MSKLGPYLILIFSLYYMLVKADPPTPTSTDFIKASCRATRYPDLCVQYLSNYSSKIQQNPRQLAQAAVSVSLARAQSALIFVSRLAKLSGLKPREYQAVKDCVENMGDTVYQLNRSVKELDGMGWITSQDFMWHMGNVQTWVSGALTNENTCLDGFDRPTIDGNVRDSIRNRVMNVVQVTSNALALVNRFAARHRAGSTTSSP